jgi:hypothetical protein
MEFFQMNAFYLATVVAVVVTISLASNLLVQVTIGPVDALMRVPLGLRRWPRHLKRLVDNWVAGMLARREQTVALSAQDQQDGATFARIGFACGRPR